MHPENALAFSAGLILLFDGEVSPVWTQTRTNQPVSWLEVINLASAFPTLRSVADGNLSPLTVAQPSPDFTGFPVIDLFSDRFIFMNPIKIQRTFTIVAIGNHLSSILPEKRCWRRNPIECHARKEFFRQAISLIPHNCRQGKRFEYYVLIHGGISVRLDRSRLGGRFWLHLPPTLDFTSVKILLTGFSSPRGHCRFTRKNNTRQGGRMAEHKLDNDVFAFSIWKPFQTVIIG